MSPLLMLSLWRERWGKADSTVLTLPYLDGPVNRWSTKLMAAKIWLLPGFPIATVLLCILSLAVVVSIQFTLNSQIVFATVIICVSLYAKRYRGRWVTLVLVGLSFIASARYLFWRLDATLSNNLDLAFVMGFILIIAELHIWILSIVDGLVDAYPLKRSSQPMVEDEKSWPTVDVFIACHGQSEANVERAARSAFSIIWPKDKIKIHLIDGSFVESTQTVASSMGFSYLIGDEKNAGVIDSLNQALSGNQGELLVIFDANQVPDKNFLLNTVGWINSDERLGMVQTPFHFLSPAPSPHSLKMIEESEAGGSCAVIRRSALSQAGGFSTENITEKSHTSLKLQSHGYISSYIGFVTAGRQTEDRHKLTTEQKTLAVVDAFRVDHPFSRLALQWRQFLSDMQEMLQFYYNLPVLIFLMAPSAYVLLDLNFIQTTSVLLLAFGLPHLLQSYWAQARLEGKPRLSILTEFKEILLGFYILISTTTAVVRAEYKMRFKINKSNAADKQKPFDPLIAWPYAVLLILNFIVFTSGSVKFILSANTGHEILIFYLGWAGYNLLTLMGMLAVAEESRHIRQQARIKSKMPVAVRLNSGHIISCVASNFPQNVLSLDLPVETQLNAGEAVNVCVRHKHLEFDFPAYVANLNNKKLTVTIEESALPNYQTLGAAVFSRGSDWPKWLPDRDADQPLPAWAVKALTTIRDRSLDLMHSFVVFNWLAGFGSLLKVWKKR